MLTRRDVFVDGWLYLDTVTYQLVVVAPDTGIMHMSKQVRHLRKGGFGS